MSFDAVEKYNTRLLILKETGMFATVAVLSNGRQKDDTKEHVLRDNPLTSCVLFPKYVFDCLHVVSFCSCLDTRQPGNVFKKLDTRQSEILTNFSK